ncbi:ATP-binding cassette [Lithospermum erythrorhizon]|uniref:ATP-binding cassette n=1 Tax=Lithospermum erythrorhizon TaxID=34254 RepID=A0AAV3P9L5_LITER
MGFCVAKMNLARMMALIVCCVELSKMVKIVESQGLADDYSGGVGSGLDNQVALHLATRLVYNRLSNVTTYILHSQISNRSTFCIKDPEFEWDRAFNYSSNLGFISACIAKTSGDMTRRLCTAAEVKFYFNNFFGSFLGSNNYLRLNKNCNLTTWVSGCEPGWACSVEENEDIDLRDSKHIPVRAAECQPCCEGFFCPRGITCMIPCPLGSYCPLASLNKNTGVCEPYSYQIPPGQPNHTCGGANLWTDVHSSGEVFCSAGSHCQTPVEQTPCSRGNYCPAGSTSENRCFKLASCDAKTSSQNIHAYGAMLIAALSTLLLIIYNCSDQIIAVRERRHAKSREAAVRSVREKVQARARWNAAKEAAKKHVKTQIARTFSRKKSTSDDNNSRILESRDSTLNDDVYSSFNQNDLGESEISEEKNIKKTHASHRRTESEGTSYSYDSFSVDMDTRSAKSKNTKEKEEVHTHSQIFKYAYSKLEKEKAQQMKNPNLTFSGVISMATNPETRRRPVMEIAFKDLTVTLKGKNKHLLRSVTGKIMPGRITAVMGPSGAGKTTFLSALAGKVVGCRISGIILINGKMETIHSYKRIVGFVPQDDIVHGNLTVEENLWFSANCRLSADLPKPEKVLIVERAIETLGLQAVRSSLVGTVEKRGISGGQRKRVNVGLELVMEPSVLFLDEPTSGLDSSSSQLLLRALRREALEGVNICMVVHQPSYTLFKIFDDLVLLAKGGLTVYHGSVKKVEEYFSGLGINVPERVNPPDYYIDVLEGMVKPSSASSVGCAELPLRWMLRNGYPMPPDMQQNAAGLSISTDDANMADHINSTGEGTMDKSFAGEIWQDVKLHVVRRHDVLRHNFLKSKDLSNRRTPNSLQQYKYFLGRISKQRLREARIHAIDYLILFLAGACLGSLIKMSDDSFGAPGYTYTIIAVSLLCKIAALRSFSLDKLQYRRESASGISSLSHFVSKDTMDHFNTLFKPLVYLSMYYFLSNPRSTFGDNYIVLVCLVYCVTGIAYVLAIFLEPGPSQLCSVIVPVVLTLIATQTKGSKFVKDLANLCYPKWALEAFVIANAERYYGVWLITRCGVLAKASYSLQDWKVCILILILIGVAMRALAFVGLITSRKK